MIHAFIGVRQRKYDSWALTAVRDALSYDRVHQPSNQRFKGKAAVCIPSLLLPCTVGPPPVLDTVKSMNPCAVEYVMMHLHSIAKGRTDGCHHETRNGIKGICENSMHSLYGSGIQWFTKYSLLAMRYTMHGGSHETMPERLVSVQCFLSGVNIWETRHDDSRL